MSNEAVPAVRFRRRRTAVAVAALAVAAIAAWQLPIYLSARAALREGLAALERDEPEAARRHFEKCLEAWPDSAEANYRAAQAARRSGDLDAATAFLLQANLHGCPAPDVEVEAALIKTQSGNLAVAESALLHHLQEGHAESPQILAVLVPAYAARFRWPEAGVHAEHWVQLRPDDLRAWRAHAEILERLRRTEPAADALRRIVERAPDDRKSRLGLVRLLIETRQAPDEAARHAEWLAETDPRDAAAQYELAACRDEQSRVAEAATILDRLIADRSPEAKVYHLRGRIAGARDAAAAIPFLRRAAELDPSDPDILYSLFLGLRRAGLPAEAEKAEQEWRRRSDDLARVRELGKSIATSPRDPELRREMGELFLRNGREAEGVRWLESALNESPRHATSHRALAAYYVRTGQPDRAARHAALAAPPGR